MIIDLESKKLMNRLERLCIGRRDANSSTWDPFETIVSPA
jgi:hypothetical protein